MLSVCILSDLHGYLPKLEPCELILICGDSVPLKIQGSSKDTYKWYVNDFRNWCISQDCNKVIFIAGNHERHFPNHYDDYKSIFNNDYKITYLCHEEYDYQALDGNTYRIFGTPYCQIFGNWAFMLPDDELAKKYFEIPEGLDILICHDAPYGVSDVLLQPGYYTGEHIGNKPLREAILRTAPKYVFHGHLHSCNHEFEELGDSKVVNCSIKDEFYNPVYKPLYINIDK